MPLNRNGTLNTQAHLANQYVDYANRGYGAAPPDWNTFLQRANQGWTVTDAFNGRQAGDQFALPKLLSDRASGGTHATIWDDSVAADPSVRPAAFPAWPSRIVLSSVFAALPPPGPPPSDHASATLRLPPSLGGQNPINPGLLGTASRQWTGAPWRAGQFSNFSGSFFPAFGIQGVQTTSIPQQPGGTVTRTPGTGLPTITTDTGPEPARHDHPISRNRCLALRPTRHDHPISSNRCLALRPTRHARLWTGRRRHSDAFTETSSSNTRNRSQWHSLGIRLSATQGSFNNPIGLRNFQQNHSRTNTKARKRWGVLACPTDCSAA